MSPGLDILNTGTGHTEIRFNGDDPFDTVRAGRIISDMLRRGYVLFIEGQDGLVRVDSFDPKKSVYIIADGPLYAGTEPEPATPDSPSADPTPDPHGPRRRGRPRKTEVPITQVRATAIGRSAGG